MSEPRTGIKRKNRKWVKLLSKSTTTHNIYRTNHKTPTVPDGR